jgi:Outer membrane receptor for ferrienterochelin and colicins
MIKQFLLTCLCVCFIFCASAQNTTYTIEGTVIVKGSKESIPFAQVLIKETNQWGFTNDNGEFKLQGVYPGTYTLQVNALGYVDYLLSIKISGNIKGFKVIMQEDNLSLQEVIVTAKSGGTINSSSKVNKQAIQHLQASNLSDIMQLVPGNLIKNPSLESQQKIVIRSTNAYDPNNAFGVAYLVNGNRIQNDASMKDRSEIPAIDFRSVSVENIESVEVLKGVVSAEYGDVMSGAVLVKTKAGRTPLQIKLKTDPYLKSIAVDKGFGLGKDRGYVNFDLDYTNFSKDIRSNLKIFDRITYGLTYSNTFNQDNSPFRFNMRFSGYYMSNNVNSDLDIGMNDYSKSKENGYNLSIYGMWLLNKRLISSLNYNFSVNYNINKDTDYSELNQSILPTTNATTEGIHVGTLTSAAIKRLKKFEDKPLYLNAKVSGHLNKKFHKTLFNTLYGVEWNTKGNSGKGIWYESGEAQYFRPSPLYDTPYVHDLNAFLEQKVVLPIYNTSLELSAGLRFTKLLYEGYDFNPIFNPRFNAKYMIYKGKRETFVRDFAIKAGYGLLDKLPGMGLLYGGEQYYDIDLFRYNETNFSLIQTAIDPEIKNMDYKTIRTKNFETGLDITLGGIEMNLTYFNERMQNGISSANLYKPMAIKRYAMVNYSGADPKYENGKLMIKDKDGNYVEHTDYYEDTSFKSKSYLLNIYENKKWGIEYDVNFGKIKYLSTSINVVGAYIRNEGTIVKQTENYVANQKDPYDVSKSFPYVGIYDGDASVSNGSISERFNTNINVITNLPKLKMVMTFTLQCVWINRHRSVYNSATTKFEDGIYHKDPIAYKDANGVVMSIQYILYDY